MKLEDVIPISWIHTHVGGHPCGFSSVDMHSQYRHGEFGMFGTVFEISRKNICEKFDFYTLTEEGTNVVGACNNPASVQHSSCYSFDFFSSIMAQVSIVDSLPLQMSNFSTIISIEGFSDQDPEPPEDLETVSQFLKIFQDKFDGRDFLQERRVQIFSHLSDFKLGVGVFDPQHHLELVRFVEFFFFRGDIFQYFGLFGNTVHSKERE